MGETRVTITLACGHTSEPIPADAEIWENPGTVVYCPDCEHDMQANIATQLALYESIQKQRDEQLDQEMFDVMTVECPNCSHMHQARVLQVNDDGLIPICPKCYMPSHGDPP